MPASGIGRSRKTPKAASSARFTSDSKLKIRISLKCRLMISLTTRSFRSRFLALPPEIQRLARKNFKLWLRDPRHPSLHFKKVGDFWSARVGNNYRALAVVESDRAKWFWIGPHDEYE